MALYAVTLVYECVEECLVEAPANATEQDIRDAIDTGKILETDAGQPVGERTIQNFKEYDDA